MQMPPIYSAIKINGKRACDLTREGKEVELKPRIITIDNIQFNGFVNGKTVEIGKEVDCGTVTGSGTQKIAVEITENGVKKAITNEFNIDDYEDNGTYYIKDK